MNLRNVQLAIARDRRRQASQLGWLLVVVAGLAVLRLPTVWYRMGGQDEQWYSVPGWTVAREGIPRIPYVPTEDPESVFRGAHRVLHALPPAYFYVQAPFFWIFPPGYGTARLASWTAGIAALLCAYQLMRQMGVERWLAVAVLPICGLGRAFTFPWQDARPDMLCAAFGLGAIGLTLVGVDQRRQRWFVLSGLLVGLGALTHPYAIVFALQVGLVILGFSGLDRRSRILGCGGAAIGTLAVLALWLPLIALDSRLFWDQFSRNVLSRSGPGFPARLIWPWEYVAFQLNLMYERFGGMQLALLGIGLVAGMAAFVVGVLRPRHIAGTARTSRGTLALVLTGSAFYLHIASLGMHPAKGYLCYPWALLTILFGVLLQDCGQILRNPGMRQRVLWVTLTVLGVATLPGSGLRATWCYATQNRQVNFNRQLFCQVLSERIPRGARLLVSPEFVFEFELLGYAPVNASQIQLYHDVQGLPFDYLLASTQAFDEGIPEALGCKLAWEMGDPEDPLACYVAVFKRRGSTPVSKPWPRAAVQARDP